MKQQQLWEGAICSCLASSMDAVLCSESMGCTLYAISQFFIRSWHMRSSELRRSNPRERVMRCMMCRRSPPSQPSACRSMKQRQVWERGLQIACTFWVHLSMPRCVERTLWRSRECSQDRISSTHTSRWVKILSCYQRMSFQANVPIRGPAVGAC
jgi:hypothetical protein